MQHYRRDALEERGGRLHLNGEPFTGVAYEVQGDRVVANHRVEAGVRGGPADDWDPIRIRVLARAITGIDLDEIDDRHPEVGDYLDGVPFKGVAYEFDEDTGILLEETDYDKDGGGPSREWYPSGALLAVGGRVRPDGGRESVGYDEGGRIRSVVADRIRWSRTPEFRLRTLYLGPGYPADDLRPVPPQVDAMLRLSGEGVTDQIVAWLDELPRLAYLDLDTTGLTAAGLARFGVAAGLRDLFTEGNAGFSDEDVRVLLARLPGCRWVRR